MPHVIELGQPGHGGFTLKLLTRGIVRVDLAFNGLELKDAVHHSPPFTADVTRSQIPNGRLGLSSRISFRAASMPLAPVR